MLLLQSLEYMQWYAAHVALFEIGKRAFPPLLCFPPFSFWVLSLFTIKAKNITASGTHTQLHDTYTRGYFCG